MMKNNDESQTTFFETELGWVGLVVERDRVKRLRFGYDRKAELQKALGTTTPTASKMLSMKVKKWIEQIQNYAAGNEVPLHKIPLIEQSDSEFEQNVRKVVRSIPFGEALTYGDVAKLVGSPQAARAVGNVMRKNEIPLLVPCHRVVGVSNLGGFSSPQGLKMKERLLIMEMGPECCCGHC